MDFQFKAVEEGGACDASNEENEYHLQLKFTNLAITNKEIKKVTLVFLYGDMLSKMDIDVPTSEDGGVLECEPKVYVIHSTPNKLSENFQNVPIIFLLLDEAKRIIGKIYILVPLSRLC